MPRSPRSNWLGPFVKSLDLDIKIVDYSTSEEFAKDFPLKKTPAFIQSDGYELTEVLAITEYLISISSNKIIGGENIKDKAQVLRWLSFINQDVFNSWAKLVFIAKTEEDKKSALDSLKNQVSYIDNQLSKRKYLAVDGYITVADEYLFSCYSLISDTIGGIAEVNYPHLVKWHATMKENDQVAKALSK